MSAASLEAMAATRVSCASATMRAEPAVSASGTGRRPSLRSVARHWPSACVWLSTFFTVASVALGRHQLVAHAQEMLADDVEVGARQQVMDIGDAARNRVLDRDHGVAHLTAVYGRKRVLERRVGGGVERGERLCAGKMRVGARLALVGDALALRRLARRGGAPPSAAENLVRELAVGTRGKEARRGAAQPPTGAAPCKSERARSRSAGVSTPSGTVSTIAASMRIPSSIARNCSSSRSSSGEGRSDTNRSRAERR